MQGTSARVSQALKPAEKLAVPVSVPTKVATKAQVAEADLATAKKRSPWMWVSIGLIILLCLGFLVARNSRLFGRLLAGNNPSANKPPSAATQSQPLPPIQNPQGTAIPLQPTPIGGVVVPPNKLLRMRRNARTITRRLNVQLDLALTYWNFNWQKETYETLGNIIKLAGPDNRDFFVQAGDKFKGQPDGWLPAASMYFQAVRAYALEVEMYPSV